MSDPRSDYLRRAASRLAMECRRNAAEGAHDRVVRQAQEAIELLLKSMLLESGIEPAKTHDLALLAQSLHGFAVAEADLQFLTEERIPAFYAAPGFIPDQAYDREDTDRCLAMLAKAGL